MTNQGIPEVSSTELQVGEQLITGFWTAVRRAL